MSTTIADLWIPQIWIKFTREKAANFPVIFNSGIVIHSSEMDALASGGGYTVNVPMFHDISDQSDEVQVENTAPVNDNKITAGVQVAAMLNRVTKNSGTALAAAVTSTDPVAEMTGQIGFRRSKQRNTTLLALLRGAFGGLTASGAAAALKPVRFDSFSEDGNNPASAGYALIDVNAFLNAKALMGELQNDLASGAIFMHSQVEAQLEKLDAVSFKTVEPGLQSGLPFRIRTYRGIPIFISDLLVRAGATSGSVYETYILSSGIVAYGEKPQTADTGITVDVAAMQYFADKDKNTEFIWDRTRFLMHLNGMKWTPQNGVPAQDTPANTELANPANWQLIYQTANRVGAVCIRTNG